MPHARLLVVVLGTLACEACSFPDYTADLGEDSTVEDVGDGAADAPTDGDSSRPDAVTDARDGETSDASSDGETCPADSGTIDASSCTNCAIAKCNSEITACSTSTTCKAFIDCTSTCRCESAAKCFGDCRTANPSHEADAVIACLTTSCASECG